MGLDEVKRYLRQWGKDSEVMELAESSATVDLAARAAGVPPERIAKTLSFMAKKAKGSEPERGDSRTNAGGNADSSAGCDAPGALSCILVVAAGDARIDGKKFKDQFGVKSKMLTPDEAFACTGHNVGGVCPFALSNPAAAVYLDVSLRRFTTVYPACGSANSIIELNCEELYLISRAQGWVDVCKDWGMDQRRPQGSKNEDYHLE